MRSYNVIGLMSGTSMDGLDVSYVKYTKSKNNEWSFDVLYTESYAYEDEFILELKSVEIVLPIHKAQLITYLKLADKRLGFLINFNVTLLKNGFQRVIQGYN